MKKNTENIGIKQIAKEAGVSMGTVDRVLHKRYGVKPETQLKVEKIIRKYNYEPNILAKRLASKIKIRFASLLPGVSQETDFWELPLAGIEHAEEEIKHYGIEVTKYFYDFADVRSFIFATEKILNSNYHGIILAPTFINEAKEFCLICDDMKIPYVLIDTNIPDVNSLTYIGPNLFKSGFAVAHLLDYIVKNGDTICLVNIFKFADTASDAGSKEEGFRFYFDSSDKKINIVRVNIKSSDYSVIKQGLKALMEKYSPQIITVMNSRVFHLGRLLNELATKDMIVVGYDYTERNIKYLLGDAIDFLICHRTQDQGYLSVMALYNKIIKGEKIDKLFYTSIDIVTKENYEFYKN